MSNLDGYKSRFSPGVRVVHKSRSYGTVGGTIISTRISHQSINYWTSKEVLMATVIFDDGGKAELSVVELYLEKDYNPDIPF